MTQPTLPTDREHDLPPLWDDLEVIWHGWQQRVLSSLEFCGPNATGYSCPDCGSLTPGLINRGTLYTRYVHNVVGISHGRRELNRRHCVGVLWAFRCPDCRHDQVHDSNDRLWDLDESDYTSAGSWEVTS